MRTFLFIGGNSDIALRTRTLLEAAGNKVLSVSRSTEHEGQVHLYGDPVLNDLPEIDEQIDGLVYFPGSITLKPFRSIKQADLQSDLEINVLGAFHSIQRYLSKMNEGSSIVLFSTVAVQTGMPFHSSVAVSKGAIEGLTRALAAEFAPKIRVNCIAPSLTNTKLASKFLSSPEKHEASAQRHPLKRVGTVDDLANSVHYLLGESSSWVTGQVLHVDGGMSRLRV
ncbi:MAG: SDR family NAD(P)-dependent oxidoreductase [Flavobacteriia bacterium]|jgi:3-oxoacyl-[acyl-carrier protein] reductase